MLDNLNMIVQRDPENALRVASEQWKQILFSADILNPEHDGREIKNIIIAGMGGSALAGLIIKKWLEDDLLLPIEIVRSYNLPRYANYNSLVIVNSYSGNTEEAISMLEDAIERGCQIGTVSSQGKIETISNNKSIAYVKLPPNLQPRMAVIYNFRALTKLLLNFNIIDDYKHHEIEKYVNFIKKESVSWGASIKTEHNLAKQIALYSAGRNALFLSSNLFSPVAYKWKISWNENAKNVSFWNEYPEFNHNEFIGWSSQPTEKLFAIFNLKSKLDNPRINKRFEISDKLLLGKRPKTHNIMLKGESLLEQVLWGSILADFASIYLAILNNNDPTPVELIEKLKIELAK